MAKETSINVANLAGVFLNMTEQEFSGVLRSRGHAKVLEDMKSIAGSALAQREPDDDFYQIIAQRVGAPRAKVKEMILAAVYKDKLTGDELKKVLEEGSDREPGEPDPEKYMAAKRAFKDWQIEIHFKDRHEDGTPKLGKFETEELYRRCCDLFGLPR